MFFDLQPKMDLKGSAVLSFFSEETYRHRVEVDGQNILLEILDTAGQVSTRLLVQLLHPGDFTPRPYPGTFIELAWSYGVTIQIKPHYNCKNFTAG